MRTIFIILITALTLSNTLFSEIDVEKVKEDFSVMQNSGNSGRDFWFTVTPMDPRFWPVKEKKIYILSTVKTKVNLSIEAKKYNRSYEVEPNQLKMIEVATNIIEPTDFDTTGIENSSLYEDMAVHLTSDFPIVVYVFSKHYYISEGYFALPTFVASTKYKNIIHHSSNYADRLIPCYTAVISPYDSTNIKLTVGGGGLKEDEIKFKDGRVIKTGESTSQKMNKGDVLLLSANGNLQDISGSLIESDKPISIVSGVSEKQLPLYRGRYSYITDMELPMNTWGKTFYFTPLKNKDSVTFLRAYASEDNTNVYRNGELVGNIKSGGGADFGDSYIEFDTWFQSIDDKPATITSDKPIALAYYNTTEIHEFIYYYDINPHLFQIPSIEQGVKSAILSAPSVISEGSLYYDLNHACITFPLEDNSIPDDIEIVRYDSLGQFAESYSIESEFEDELHLFEGQFEGRDYGSINLEMKRNCVYQIRSSRNKFVVYSYGTSFTTGFGFPSGFSLYDRGTDDVTAPTIEYEQQCNGNIDMGSATVTDLTTNGEFSSNIADIYMMAGENYEFNWESIDEEFIPGQTHTLNWSLIKLDNRKPASALLYLIDKAGNDTTILIESNPEPEYLVSSTDLELRNPKTKAVMFQDTIRNLSDIKSLFITRVELGNPNSEFKIVSYSPTEWEPGVAILPNEEIYVNIIFDKENIEDKTSYSDSLFIGIGALTKGILTECTFESKAELTLHTEFPDFRVLTENDFGEFENESTSMTLQDTIRNESENNKLYISRIELKEGNIGFSISGYKPFGWDIEKPIEPMSEIIVEVVFNPNEIERTEDDKLLIDSLGVGVSEYNTNNELEEILFSYSTEQKALLKAKDPESNVILDKILGDYLTQDGTTINIEDRVIREGYYELSIYNLEGSRILNYSLDNQKSISLSNLTSGKYFITLISEKNILTEKFNIVK